MKDILPPGEYRITTKLVCSPDACRLVAEVVGGRFRGTQLVVQTYQRELSEEVQAARSQSIRALRVKYGSSDTLDKFIKETDKRPESWLVYFDDYSFDRYRLYDEFSEFVYGRGTKATPSPPPSTRS